MARLAHQTSHELITLSSLPEQQIPTMESSMMRSPTPVRRSARNTRAGSVDSVQSESAAAFAPSRKNKGKGRAVDMKTELPTLAEQEEVSQLAPLADMSGHDHTDVESELRAQLSGFAAQASQELDVPDMIDTLPALLFAAKRLLESFLQDDEENAIEKLARELQVNSKVRQRFDKLDGSFRPLRDFYGIDAQYFPFINIDAVVAFIADTVNGPFESEGLRLILSVANLAIVIVRVFVIDDHFSSFLQVWDNICPLPFVSYVENPGEAFEINLEVRTKRAVDNLFESEKLGANFDPLLNLRSIFYEQQSAEYSQESFPPPRKIAGDEEEPRHDTIAARYTELASTISVNQDNSYNVDLVKLNDQFRWTAFLRYVVQYTATEYDAITEKITALGNVPTIVKSLSGLLIRDDTVTRQLDYESQGLDLNLRPHFSIIGASRGLGHVEQFATAPRRLVDPHPHAEKVQFDNLSMQSTPRIAKRTANDMEEELSQDGGFQADREPTVKRAKRRPALGQSPAQPRAKRTRKSKPVQTAEELAMAEMEIARRRDMRNNNPDAVDSVPFSQIAETARAIKARLAPREPQIRKPWDDHDCELLVEAISRFGSGWAQIERNYLNQWHRERCNQIDMKDKARNMKVTYLTSDTPLPPGFDTVYLGKKEILKVQKVGKNPYRKEGEMPGNERLNMNGEPIELDHVNHDLQDMAFVQPAPDPAGTDVGAQHEPITQ